MSASEPGAGRERSSRPSNWIQKRSVRNLAALLVIGFGVWTIAWVVYHRILAHEGHETDTTLEHQRQHKPHSAPRTQS